MTVRDPRAGFVPDVCGQGSIDMSYRLSTTVGQTFTGGWVDMIERHDRERERQRKELEDVARKFAGVVMDPSIVVPGPSARKEVVDCLQEENERLEQENADLKKQLAAANERLQGLVDVMLGKKKPELFPEAREESTSE